MLGNPESWQITTEERSKHDHQFNILKPINGYINGEQAKNFFMKSGLQTLILGQIWALSDLDKDGRMNPKEFSIAMYLIKKKLEGAQLPATLPNNLRHDPVPPYGTPHSVPPSSVNTTGYNTMPAGGFGAFPSSGLQFSQNGGFPVYPPGGHTGTMVSGAFSAAGFPPGSAPATPVPGGRPAEEWTIPNHLKPRYRLQFNQQDRLKRGFITGVEAKAILVQSQLPQHILAQIWHLSDIDRDGNLTCDEYCVSMYLVDQALAGVPLPSSLPTSLIPASMQGRRGSLGPGPTQTVAATIPAPGGPTEPKVEGNGVPAKPVQTIEDRRRENFLKGQAELERRQALLRDQLKKEEDERMEKERAEQERMEKIRQEKERQRQLELERQMERHRQVEQEREDQRRRAEHERERARRELERQRLMEVERKRLETALQDKNKEQQSLEQAQTRQANLVENMANLEEKRRDTESRLHTSQTAIEEARVSIQGMRAERDAYEHGVTDLQASVEAAKAELNRWQRERENLSLRVQTSVESNPISEQYKALQSSFQLKKSSTEKLHSEITSLENDMTKKGQELATKRNKVQDFEKKLQRLLNEVSTLQKTAQSKAKAYRGADLCDETSQGHAFNTSSQLVQKDAFSDLFTGFNAAGATAGSGFDAWPSSTTGDSAPARFESAWSSTNAQDGKKGSKRRVQALYDFEARQTDELSFSAGDIIEVDPNSPIDVGSGWLFGRLGNSGGIFPESYVRPHEGGGQDSDMSAEDGEVMSAFKPVTTNQGLPLEAPSTAPVVEADTQANSVWAEAVYAWEAKSANNVSFEAGDRIRVMERQDEWWSGEVNGKLGWFPRDYVKLVEQEAGRTAGPSVPGRQASLNSEEPVYDTIPGDALGYCVALYVFESGESGDLPLAVGDVVQILRQDEDWWEGRKVNTDKRGLFPESFVKKMSLSELEAEGIHVSSMKQTNVQSETATDSDLEVVYDQLPEAKISPGQPTVQEDMRSSTPGSVGTPETLRGGAKPEIAQVIVPYTASGPEQLSLEIGQLIQIRKKSATGWWEGELQQRGQKRRIGWFPADYVRVLGATGGPGGRPSSSSLKRQEPPTEQVSALYTYTAQNVDELTFEKGAVITVVSKDEPEWWRGRIANGAEGLFPVNYVRRLPAALVGPSDSPSLANLEDKLKFDVWVTDIERKRQFHILELIETEHTYYQDLQEVQKVFYEPLLQSGLITEEELAKIFVNWKDLIPKSFSFYMALKIRKDNSGINQPIESIGDILISNFPNFISYVRFCSCQNQALSLLQKRMVANPKFREFCQACEQKTRSRVMPMASYFLKPMQRITKYRLLVENILKYTDEFHPDRGDLEEAVAAARSLCESVNEGVREQENSERLEWLQEHVQCDGLNEKLYFNSQTNCLGHRRLLKCGTLFKAKSGKEVVAFLFNDFLLLTTPTFSTGGTPFVFPTELSTKSKMQFRVYKKPIFLNQVLVQTSPEAAPDTFTVAEPGVVHSLRGMSTSDRDKWFGILTSASKSYLETENSQRQRSLSIHRSAGVGRLLVTIVEGVNLKPGSVGGDAPGQKKTGKSDPYCEATLGNQMHKTNVVASNLNPKWNANMQFQVKNLEQDVLCLTVYDKDYFAPNDFLGRLEIRLSEVTEQKSQVKGPIEMRRKLKEVQTGEIILKLDLHLFNAT